MKIRRKWRSTRKYTFYWPNSHLRSMPHSFCRNEEKKIEKLRCTNDERRLHRRIYRANRTETDKNTDAYCSSWELITRLAVTLWHIGNWQLVFKCIRIMQRLPWHASFIIVAHGISGINCMIIQNTRKKQNTHTTTNSHFTTMIAFGIRNGNFKYAHRVQLAHHSNFQQ